MIAQVCVNTEESIFEELKVETKEKFTNTKPTVTTDTGIQTPVFFKKAMRNRATMTDSGGEEGLTNFTTEVEMQRAINRASKAEVYIKNNA